MTGGTTACVEHDEACQIMDEAWDELQRGTYVQRALGTKPLRFPDLSLEEAQRRTALGKSLLKRIATIDSEALPHELALTLRVIAFRARVWVHEESWYWTVIDPLGIGMFGMFLPTAYCGGWFLNHLHGQLAAISFETYEDADGYLRLIDQYGRIIEQFGVRTAGQAERGMYMPKPQVRQARDLLTRFKTDVRNALGVTPERLTQFTASNFLSELDALITGHVLPAFDVVLDGLSDTYLGRAPDTVGIGQYSGGAAIYSELVKFHTTMDLTPEQVHATGHARMAEIVSEMRSIRQRLGFDGDNAAFLARIAGDPNWRASSVDGVKAYFERYIARVRPLLTECFHTIPQAGCDAIPLPEALQASMTYGYYEPPREGERRGHYLFNTSNLTKQPLMCLASLTYHELIPGHHLQLALQQENESLDLVRRHSIVNAYVEGWAEYAATLAGEMGCYEQPEERYGRLVMDAFLTCRLVVDTGLNAMGWSLDRAQCYMKEYTAMTDGEIATDSTRYSCDIPGQGLTYKIGDAMIAKLRERMRRRMGTEFDIKDFHTAVLETGAVPLPDLEWHVERVLIRSDTIV